MQQPADATNTTSSLEARLEALFQRMTLAEKIGQMTQVEKNSITPDEVAEYGIGSVLSGGGGNPIPNSPESWAEMVRSFAEGALRSRLRIPLLYGVDAVHGHSNVRGAVIFPHNVGLGAARDADLTERAARITALECRATGVQWDFAPAVPVPHDIRWGRTFEGFGEDTELVSELGTAYLRGLQNMDGLAPLVAPNAVLASVKHFVGDGGTTWGSTPEYEWLTWWGDRDGDIWHLDQGVTDVDEAALRAVHLPPYQAAIAAGAVNIMVSYSSWGGSKMHAQKYLLTDVLKGEMGFDGFLISDWLGIYQLSPDFYTCVVDTVNAGMDMVMVPFEYRRFIDALTEAVEKGDVSAARIDDAVRRILRVKLKMGLFERPLADRSLIELVGCAAHREVAREAVRKSLVLLKNEEHLLPLAKDTRSILVAGKGADDIGIQCGGWTIEWGGATGNITPGTTVLAGIKQTVSDNTRVIYRANGDFDLPVVDVGLVVVSELPYVEGMGDRSNLALSAEDVELVERVRSHCNKLVVMLISGRPLIVTDQIDQWDAFVAVWLPGTEGQGIADVLFGDYPFSGKLPLSWPRSMAQIPLSALRADPEGPLFPFGFGL